MPRRRFEPTAEQRTIVKAMASYGVPQQNIAEVIGCSIPTLEKYFKKELALAAVEANAMVAQTLYKMATSGKCPAATFFWLKTRARWREKPDAPIVPKEDDLLRELAEAIRDSPK